MKPYFLSVILIVSWFQHVALDDQSLGRQCIRRELGEKASPHWNPFKSTHLEAKCYRQCSQEDAGVIVNGKINPNKVKEAYYPLPKHSKLEKAAVECLTIEAPGKCELGDKLFGCIMKHMTEVFPYGTPQDPTQHS